MLIFSLTLCANVSSHHCRVISLVQFTLGTYNTDDIEIQRHKHNDTRRRLCRYACSVNIMT